MQQPSVYRNRSGDPKISNHEPRPGPESASSDDGSDKNNKEFGQRTVGAISPLGDALNTNPASDPITDHTPKPGLTQGLQVPSRFSYATSGFKFPKILKSAGITKAEWLAFTSDIKLHAGLSSKQWAKSIGCGLGVFYGTVFYILPLAVIPAAMVGHSMRKDAERRNIVVAYHCGLLNRCLDHWNESCFKPKGLVVGLSLPGMSPDLANMDLATSRFFGNRVTVEDSPAVSNAAEYSAVEDRKTHRAQIKADRARRRALLKCRIVIKREIGNITVQ